MPIPKQGESALPLRISPYDTVLLREVDLHTSIAPPPLADIHVLVVEDDEDGREMLRALLEGSGARVTVAGETRSAFELLLSVSPDLLLSDIGLPGEDGYGLMRRVRALTPEQGGMLPAIALTANASASDRNRAMEAGFQAHLAKPCEPSELTDTIARWVVAATDTPPRSRRQPKTSSR